MTFSDGEMINAKPLGQEMRRLRETRGITQEGMASRLGYTRPDTYADFEHGRRVPRREVVLRFSALLYLTQEEFVRLRSLYLPFKGATKERLSIETLILNEDEHTGKLPACLHSFLDPVCHVRTHDSVREAEMRIYKTRVFRFTDTVEITIGTEIIECETFIPEPYLKAADTLKPLLTNLGISNIHESYNRRLAERVGVGAIVLGGLRYNSVTALMNEHLARVPWFRGFYFAQTQRHSPLTRPIRHRTVPTIDLKPQRRERTQSYGLFYVGLNPVSRGNGLVMIAGHDPRATYVVADALQDARVIELLAINLWHNRCYCSGLVWYTNDPATAYYHTHASGVFLSHGTAS